MPKSEPTPGAAPRRDPYLVKAVVHASPLLSAFRSGQVADLGWGTPIDAHADRLGRENPANANTTSNSQLTISQKIATAPPLTDGLQLFDIFYSTIVPAFIAMQISTSSLSFS